MTSRKIAAAAGALFALSALAMPAARPQQDVVDPAGTGRIRFTLLDSESREPVANAAVQLDDPTGSEARRTLYSGADGTVLSGPLAAHEWRFIVLHPRYKKASGSAPVVAGRTLAVAARF